MNKDIKYKINKYIKKCDCANVHCNRKFLRCPKCNLNINYNGGYLHYINCSGEMFNKAIIYEKEIMHSFSFVSCHIFDINYIIDFYEDNDIIAGIDSRHIKNQNHSDFMNKSIFYFGNYDKVYTIEIESTFALYHKITLSSFTTKEIIKVNQSNWINDVYRNLKYRQYGDTNLDFISKITFSANNKNYFCAPYVEKYKNSFSGCECLYLEFLVSGYYNHYQIKNKMCNDRSDYYQVLRGIMEKYWISVSDISKNFI